MCLAGALLRSVLVVLLLANSCGKRRCNYKEILGSYREVVVVELQNLNLNLTGSPSTSKERDPCPSGKCYTVDYTRTCHICVAALHKRFGKCRRRINPSTRRILVSIYGMTQQMRCQRRSPQLSDLLTPLQSMEQLIVHNCSPKYLGKKASCSGVQKIRGKKRKRMKLVKVIRALITCWQKLRSVYMLSK